VGHVRCDRRTGGRLQAPTLHSPNSDRPRHRDDTTRHAPTHTALPNGYAVTISGAGHDTQTDQRPGQRL
jgi:hypothetical protein